MKKRGLSDLITVILIILLAVAAVVIVWAFVQPLIQDVGTTAVSSAACLQVKVKPTGCSGTNVNVQLTSAGSGVNVVELGAVVTQAGGAKISGTSTNVPAELATEPITISAAAAVDDIARAFVKIQDDDGNEVTCGESAESVKCK